MFDFSINDCGDLTTQSNHSDIDKVQGGDLIRQLALVRIKSVTKDWFNHNQIGANLEALCGDMISHKTIKDVEDAIIISISDIIHEDDIYITSTLDATVVRSKVFLKIDDNKTLKIDVNIDLIGGVSVIYEINTQ